LQLSSTAYKSKLFTHIVKGALDLRRAILHTMHKRNLVIVLGLFLVMIVTGALLLNKDKISDFVSNSKAGESVDQETLVQCSDEAFAIRLIDNGLLLSQNLQELSELADEVLAMTNYENSPNCMYVLTYYSINSGDSENVKQRFVQLVNAYNNNSGYVGSLADMGLLSPPELQPSIDIVSGDAGISNTAIFEWESQ